MRVRITKCTNKEKGSVESWYKDKVGIDFLVVDSNQWYHWVVYNNLAGKPCRNLINVDDCKEIKE